MNNLAIIIPAYKAKYLAETLESFTNQTNKNFTIYIGDDASPHNLKKIVDNFTSQLHIVYHRFPDNMGAKSLTRQWERCINLSSEEWIWLFSDDDIVEKNAVQLFFEKNNDKNLFYKFKTKIINEYNEYNEYFKKYDKLNLAISNLNSYDFIINRLECNGFRSFAVEYIFHRSLYEKTKFVDFPLAWASDDATWFLYSLKNNKNITILDTFVYWRYSDINISSDNLCINTIKSKILASCEYIKWLKSISKIYSYDIQEKYYHKWLLMQLISLNKLFTYNEIKELLHKANLYSKPYIIFRYIIFVYTYNLYKKIKNA